MIEAENRASPAFVLSHLALCSLAWGSSFYFIKLLGTDLVPVQIATLRGLIAMLALMLFIIARGGMPLPARDEIVPWLTIGLLNGALPNTLVAFAMQRMDSGPAVLIQSIGPLLTAVMAHHLFADERLGPRAFAGVAVGLAGVFLLIGPDARAGHASLSGALAMLVVATSYALGNIYTRLVRHHDPIRLALGQQMGSTLLAGLVTAFIAPPLAAATIAHHALPLLMLGIVTTALPIAVFMRLIVRAGPTRAALTGYTVPAVAVIIGVFALNERLSLWQIAGGLTVFLGVYLAATAKRSLA
ncbi:MAG: DMT family transporter [Proteobacteria bacterium]|nr:DMT family transporter [Pseudomonadota bacterium]